MDYLAHVNNMVQHPNASQKNRFIYVKQDFLNPLQSIPPPALTQQSNKVLINPHFRKSVYVNPQFNLTSVSNKIHVNPNVLRNLSTTLLPRIDNNVAKTETRIISTKNKFIRIQSDKASNERTPQRKRRISLHTKYKIIRTSAKIDNRVEKRNSGVLNKFKLDKRNDKQLSISFKKSKNKKKFVYINRFLTLDIMAKNVLLKNSVNFNQSKVVKINGILYKKSPNSLKRQSDHKEKTPPLSSKYKIVRGENGDKTTRAKKRKTISKSKSTPSKLKKCNIPCAVYRKFGHCKGKDNGSCVKVHNPDQIVLCPRFLQGACHDDKCPLSHKVSYEKMPTCKYFLEGLCSKDNCQYLHVKISPKADICRDFLAGFCKRAAECDKRHQFLCPDYEKNGNCVKKKCPYPHGSLVRTKRLKSTNAKKCSKKSKIIENCLESVSETGKSEKNRYYEPDREKIVNCDKIHCIETVSRPKLGQLPSFIPFEENQ